MHATVARKAASFSWSAITLARADEVIE